MTTPPKKIFLWTIFESPADYPGQYIARKFDCEIPTAHCFWDADLEVVREFVFSELLKSGVMNPVCFGRDVQDAPQVLETWL